MGIYFIAAGLSSNNRKKSLDKAFKTSDLISYLPVDIKQKLYACFGEDESIYVWGAN
ncbi:MAG: hypothetical protein JJU13_09365 [Balneolaceae bacterium]|nr:hypothetical protein [Balneolaceae bacterium]